MKEAGCVGMRIGFESGNDEILRKVRKNTTLEQARKAMKIIKKYDMKTFGFFMIGLSEDTEKTINQTIDFAIELEPTFASFAITTPFPGTEMFKEYIDKKWMPANINLHNMTLHDSELTRTNKLTPAEIFNYYKKAKRRFYLRWGYLKRISKYLITHPKEAEIYFLRLISKLKNDI